MDIVYLGSIIAFFGLMVALTGGCRKLGGPQQ
jgi:hypothetical protein